MSQNQEIEWLLSEKYGGKKTAKALQDIKRIKRGEPTDYVIGFVEFLGCKINLSSRPLIPRSETEYWVERAIQELQKHVLEIVSPSRNAFSPLRCLDIFAGSGCIGVAVLKYVPGATVDFAENNKILLSQIEKNVLLNKISKTRYRVIQSNILSRIFSSYDYIFANPPYLAESRRNRAQALVLKWERQDALFGGEDGLKYIRTFLKEAKNHLNPGGTIYMEFDSFQKLAIHKLLKEYGYSSWEFYKDQYGKWRYVIVYEK